MAQKQPHKQRNTGRLRTLYQAIRDRPGRTIGQIACTAGLSYSEALNSLPTMERNGYLVTEDDDGRLYPYQEED